MSSNMSADPHSTAYPPSFTHNSHALLECFLEPSMQAVHQCSFKWTYGLVETSAQIRTVQSILSSKTMRGTGDPPTLAVNPNHSLHDSHSLIMGYTFMPYTHHIFGPPRKFSCLPGHWTPQPHLKIAEPHSFMKFCCPRSRTNLST